jgi:hypothetical protein
VYYRSEPTAAASRARILGLGLFVWIPALIAPAQAAEWFTGEGPGRLAVPAPVD